MTIKINGENVSVLAAGVFSDTFQITKVMEVSEAARYENSVFLYDGKSYEGTRLQSLFRDDLGNTVAAYKLRSEADVLREEVASVQNELSDKLADIKKVKDAVAALGSGVPTLTKLISFLTAVKEAIHYGE